MNEAPRRLVIGVGNVDRGDDAVGLLIARELKRILPGDATVLEQGGDGAELLELWSGGGRVVVIDSADCPDPPGTVHRFDAIAGPVPVQAFARSTHAFGLAEAVELSRALGRLPAGLVIYGIVGKCFDLGAALSPAVEAAAGAVIPAVLAELGNRI